MKKFDEAVPRIGLLRDGLREGEPAPILAAIASKL